MKSKMQTIIGMYTSIEIIGACEIPINWYAVAQKRLSEKTKKAMNLFGSLNLLTALFIVGIVKRNSNGYILYNAILMIYELISVKDFGKELKETAQIIHTKDLPEEERITIKSDYERKNQRL